ncbi:hypothetical protein CUJ91_02980 [Paraburkholderia graminis]|jgi:hypothetical protein|nr:hypothetical protein CUJ91_02980 [Paraburkholderia graminis]
MWRAFVTRVVSETRDLPMHRQQSPENVTPNILQICAKAKTSSAVKCAVSPIPDANPPPLPLRSERPRGAANSWRQSTCATAHCRKDY